MRRLLLAAALAAAGAAYAADKKLSEAVEIAEGRLRFDAPVDWHLTRDAERDKRDGIHGYVLHSPEGPDGGGTIVVEYYAPENRLFAGPQDFIDANTRKRDAEKRPKVKADTFKGRKAWTFVDARKYAVDPAVIPPKLIDLRDEYWVVQGDGTAFYAAVLTARADAFDRQRKVFRRLLKSLRFPPPAK